MTAAHMTTFQAIVLGVLQGVTELFPISSLGHTVIFPNLFGWDNIVAWQSEPESPWLAFVVMLHVGSAVGLLIYFWRTWLDVIGAFFATLRKRRVETSTERLAWLIIVATIPVGILGLLLEHPVRVALAKPLAASIFLVVNGVILLGAERLRRRSDVRALAAREGAKRDGGRRLDTLEYREAGVIGFAQSFALIAGLEPRRPVHVRRARCAASTTRTRLAFAFLLATPPILAAGVLKIGDLTGSLGAGIRGRCDHRRDRRGDHRDNLRSLPDPLVQDPDADAVRDLLRGVRASRLVIYNASAGPESHLAVGPGALLHAVDELQTFDRCAEQSRDEPQPGVLGAHVEQPLLGVEAEVDGRGHRVGAHVGQLVGLGLAISRAPDQLGVGAVRGLRELRVDRVLPVLDELDDARRVGKMPLALDHAKRAGAARPAA